MREAHLVTGATGFIGSALVLELLQKTDVDVICVVRPRAGQSAAERLTETLLSAAGAFGYSGEVADAVRTRCEAVAGDVEKPMCGVEALPPRAYTQLWHSAASLRFEERYVEEIRAVNVQGTRHVVHLARDLAGVKWFNYMSTAYVAGRSTGVVHETSAVDHTANNSYEASKIEAEAIVAGASGMQIRIFRPSIVIGHSRTFAAINFTGMYGFLRKLVAYRGMLERTQKELAQDYRMAVRVDVGVPLNLVPIDAVVEPAVRVATFDPSGSDAISYYHLTNPTPPAVDTVVSLIFKMAGLAPPRFVTDRTTFQWLDEKFDERITFYSSYLEGHKTFDRSHLCARLPDEHDRRCDLEGEALVPYLQYYLERLEQERSSLPETR